MRTGGWTWRGRRCRLREPRVLRRSGQRPATDSGDSIIYAAACHSKWAVRRQCPFTVSVLGRQASTRRVAQQLAEKKTANSHVRPAAGTRRQGCSCRITWNRQSEKESRSWTCRRLSALSTSMHCPNVCACAWPLPTAYTHHAQAQQFAR